MSRPRRRFRLKELRHLVFPPLARALLLIFSLPPLWLARRIGSGLGFLAWFVLTKERRLAESQLAIAFPDRTDARERRRLSRGVFRHFGRFALEMPVLLRWGAARVRQSFEFPGFDRVNAQMQSLIDEGNGVIAVVPHLGHWELVGSVGCDAWPSAVVIAKRYRVPGYQRLVDGARRRLGCRIVYQDDSMLPVVRHLRRGGVLGVLPDLDAKRLSGTFVPFFGRDAYTTDSVAQLSRKLGVPIVVMWCVRDGDDYRFEMTEPIRPDVVRDEPDPDRALTLRWLERVERVIRRYPDQWVWLHDRWHSTPETLAHRRERERQRAKAELEARDSS